MINARLSLQLISDVKGRLPIRVAPFELKGDVTLATDMWRLPKTSAGTLLITHKESLKKRKSGWCISGSLFILKVSSSHLPILFISRPKIFGCRCHVEVWFFLNGLKVLHWYKSKELSINLFHPLPTFVLKSDNNYFKSYIKFHTTF